MSKITKDFMEAALREGYVLKTTKSSTPANAPLVNAAVIELLNLGFMIKPEELKGMSIQQLQDTIDVARKVIGADRGMKPVYPGFPKQVEELSTSTLLMEQILHYWSAGEINPNYPDIIREGLPLEDMLKVSRKVKVTTASKFAKELINNIVTAKIAMAPNNEELLSGAVQLNRPTLQEAGALLTNSSNGENISKFIKILKDECNYTASDLIINLAQYCDSSDQLLRLIVNSLAYRGSSSAVKNIYPTFTYGGGDPYMKAVKNLHDEYAYAVSFKSPSKAARRAIVKQLGLVTRGDKADYLNRKVFLWRRVMKAVHPYSLKLSIDEKRALDITHSNINYKSKASEFETALEDGRVKEAIDTLAVSSPGSLLRSLASILRHMTNISDAEYLGRTIEKLADRYNLTTLISSYNGLNNSNRSDTTIVRIPGRENYLKDNSCNKKINEDYLNIALDALRKCMTIKLKNIEAPKEAVAVSSSIPVNLFLRDSAFTDKLMERGESHNIDGSGDILRIFGHWNNNMSQSGYMDIGVVILDEDFEKIAVSTWDTWNSERDWSTYSGDKLVHPADSASEFIDVNLKKLLKKYPNSKWAVMTVQSYTGWPINDVDFIAGSMLRSDGERGEVFEARTVENVAHPTTTATQSVPLAIDLETMKMYWIDSSNGSTRRGMSSSHDSTIGIIVKDEIKRPRMTYGELALLWAEAHNSETTDDEVDLPLIKNLLK